MNAHKRVDQMAHLNQKLISDNSCKAIIVDTILDSEKALTRADISNEITSIFHILVSKERLEQLINSLVSDGILSFDLNDYIELNPVKKSEYIVAKLQETNLRKEATLLWIEYIESFRELSDPLRNRLSRALPIFLRTLFIRHGVSSYELLTANSDFEAFDLKQIAKDVSKQFNVDVQADLEELLPTIFQNLSQPTIMEYLKHNINKAVGYISEVISDENLSELKCGLEDLILYLDTNTLYRLLNLQGNARYESIKETIDFCRANGVKLKVSALTKKELSSRLKYDASVLTKFPITADLSQCGYKYRTSDNYVSTYWLQAQRTKISVRDYIAFYQHFDVLLEDAGIEIEKIEIDEDALIERAKILFEKMSLQDSKYEKGDFSLWHDAYNFAYIQKMQKIDAKTAIDTGCLFMTTDQSLIALQRKDHDLKNLPPVVITPSQLLQLFSFSMPDSGFEETFIKFFASTSLGITFQYDNNDLQEILSRISHYQGIRPDIAEKILCREIVNSRYFEAKTEVEKEEIIYNAISDELISELNLTQEQLVALKTEKEKLGEDRNVALDLLIENERQFEGEKLKLRNELKETIQARNQETSIRQQAEKASREMEQYSEAQETLYVDEKWNKWKKHHLWMVGGSIISIIFIVGLSIALWLYKKDLGFLGLLALLPIPLFILPFGCAAYSTEKENEIRSKILDDYHKKLK